MAKPSRSPKRDRKRSSDMDYSNSGRTLDVSGKDHYMDGSYHRQEHSRGSYAANAYSDRQGNIEGIISPKRGLGKALSDENAVDGIFRAPSTATGGLLKLPFLGGKKKNMDTSSSSRRALR